MWVTFPRCNVSAPRPRLEYLSNCSAVPIPDQSLQNPAMISQFPSGINIVIRRSETLNLCAYVVYDGSLFLSRDDQRGTEVPVEGNYLTSEDLCTKIKRFPSASELFSQLVVKTLHGRGGKISPQPTASSINNSHLAMCSCGSCTSAAMVEPSCERPKITDFLLGSINLPKWYILTGVYRNWCTINS